jgi:hypothetical protein
MSEKIERIARTTLWFVLALVFLAFPIGVIKARSGDSEAVTAAKAALKQAEEKLAELTKPKGPPLFPLKSVGVYLSSLRLSTAEGMMNFTNTTDQSGILCLRGTAKNAKSGETSDSIADCHEVKPYESNVRMVFYFAGGELHKLCPQEGDCALSAAPVADKPKE